MTHPEVRKFLFEKSFSKKDMAHQKNFVSPEELALAKSAAYEAGYQASQESLEAINKQQLDSMKGEIKRLFEESEERLHLLHHAVAKLAQCALEVAFPYYARKAGVEEVWGTIATCLEKEGMQPQIKVFVSPVTFESIQSKMSTCSFEGDTVQVVCDPRFEPTDCRLEWQDSGYERLEKVIQSDLIQLLQRLDAQESADLTQQAPIEDISTQGEVS
ncbi:MAG: hypothetical protein ACK5TR_01765 [Alphaproteobacteria bacterium]|jgi:flagellar biosynthesis/type III secretory pathway protein FliH